MWENPWWKYRQGHGVYKQIEIEPNFSTIINTEDDFKFRFVYNTYINQNILNKHCITNLDRITVCTTHLTALDPIVINHAFDIPNVTTDIYL